MAELGQRQLLTRTSMCGSLLYLTNYQSALGYMNYRDCGVYQTPAQNGGINFPNLF